MSGYVDTRDLAKERADLQSELEFLAECAEEADEPMEREEALDELNEARERIAAIDELEAECGCALDDGVTMIPEDEFEDYARELAEDIGAISSEYRWPQGCIDWERAAWELAMDYTRVEFDGVTYLVQP